VPLVVATANVLGTLRRGEAGAAVAAVLEHQPDLVALQEWHPWRAGVLGRFGDYEWFTPVLGGCVVGARRERFRTLTRRTWPLSPPGRADRSGRFLGLEPPRRAATTLHLDHRTGAQVLTVSFHLASQVQGRGDAYRADRPVLVARHQREAAALARLVAGRQEPTYVCGDSNFHGFGLPGLVSAWRDRADAGGTLGPRRRIDDVLAPEAPLDVLTVATPSDHLAVVARYA
jgi:endonuclease/exonuclease/phosphatase family metal-dependent hydrolase